MEKICYIVGAGENYGLDFTPRAEDLVIAADAGYRALREAGIRPNLVVGDFDSLGAAPAEKHVVVLPKIKDITDTWAAIQLGMERGYRNFALYGCTGGRFEHTLANVQTVAHVTEQGMTCRLYDRTQVITALHNGAMEFGAAYSGFLSVFSHTDRCTGVYLKGLKYELDNAELTSSFPLGVSNEFLGIPSSVTIGAGTAILVFDRKKLDNRQECIDFFRR